MTHLRGPLGAPLVVDWLEELLEEDVVTDTREIADRFTIVVERYGKWLKKL